MGNSKYLLAIVWLSVLIGSSASNSFQRISASPEREACVTDLVQIRGNLMVSPELFDILSDSILCLFQSESDFRIQGQPCVTDLVQVKVNPNATAKAAIDSLANSIICLSRTGTGTIERQQCATDLEQILADPNVYATVTFGEWASTISDAIICVART